MEHENIGCCGDCCNARQVGDKSRQDVCGCVVETESMDHFPIQFFKGWYFAKRVIDDISDKDNCVGRGAMINGNITKVTHTCRFFMGKS